MFDGGSSPEDYVYASQYQLQLCPRQPAHSLRQLGLVESDDLRDVRYRFLRKACGSLGEENVSGRRGPLDVACERHAYDRRYAAPVQAIALNDNNGSSESRLRSPWFTGVCPPHLALGDRHHSVRSSVRWPALDANLSTGSLT